MHPINFNWSIIFQRRNLKLNYDNVFACRLEKYLQIRFPFSKYLNQSLNKKIFIQADLIVNIEIVFEVNI